MLELIGSVRGTRVLLSDTAEQPLSCWLTVDVAALNTVFFSFFTLRLCIFHFSFRLCFLRLKLQRCQHHLLFFCARLIEFSYLIQCFIIDQCFITVLSWQLDNCLTTYFFLVTVDPRGLPGIKKSLEMLSTIYTSWIQPGWPQPPFIYRSVPARLCTVRKKLLILNWGCFPHLSKEGH